MSRRRFLAGLGVLAGASALVPWLRRVGLEETGTVEVLRPGLGTWIRVVARDGDRRRAERAVEAAFAAIREVDRQMSVHRADSQLSRVNRAAGRGAVAVDREVIEVVSLARAAAERSGGLYDPTVLPLMRLYGFYGQGETPYPSDRAIARTLATVDWRQVALDPARRTLGLEHAGAGLDLGSIGKGWALDRAVDALRRLGVRSALVDVGGNSYGLGTPEPGLPGWSVGVLHPVTKQVDRVFTLRDAAVATSGNYEQFRILSGLRVGHLFDARRGRPADGHLSASVLAQSGVESDVMSTVSFLLGPSAFRGWPGALGVHFIG
ncbi:MAG TPA: FAD:protein FMN transferase [Candidatus Eisenbacteria bacterium]